MEQSTEKLGFIPSWPPNCSSEAGASYSQSASSAIISPVGADVQCESSTAQTDSSPLREHDYIGLSEISSTASLPMIQQKLEVRNDDNEPDLRLGLGPSPAKSVGDGSLHAFFEPRRDLTKGKTPCPSKSDVAEVIYNIAHIHQHSSSTSSAPSMKRPDVQPICAVISDPYVKSAKRSFTDTINQAIPDARLHARVTSVAAGEDTKTGTMLTTGQVRMIVQMPDMDTKSLMRHPQMVYWAAPWSASRNAEVAHTVTSYGGQVASGKPGDIPRGVKKNAEFTPPGSKLVMRNIEPEPDAPPAKEQMVGWPPVRSYRRSAIAAAQSSSPAEIEGDSPSVIFVKVNMDGIPIGRKVGLSSYTSYEELLVALEGMFHSPHMGESTRFLHARDYVLTYEDKEGDWMLVGDVPWSMFVNTVKRLRIIRGSDSSCLGSST